MAFTLVNGARHYSPCQHPEAFTHCPVTKGRNAIRAEFIHPGLHKARFDTVWATIKAQDWFEADVGLVMVGSDGFAYCQYPGQTTGLARVFVGVEA
jgi:hypothetical protein